VGLSAVSPAAGQQGRFLSMLVMHHTPPRLDGYQGLVATVWTVAIIEQVCAASGIPMCCWFLLSHDNGCHDLPGQYPKQLLLLSAWRCQPYRTSKQTRHTAESVASTAT
jgi:hypothetical protein